MPGGRKIFFNLPVTSLSASEAFITALGFNKKTEWCWGNDSACFEGTESTYIFYQSREIYKKWLPKDMSIADTKQVSSCIITFNAESQAEVDELIEKGIEAGGARGPNMVEQMGADAMAGCPYSRSVSDPDGHLFEIIFSPE